VFADYRAMLRDPDLEMVTIAAPNRWHAVMTLDIARAGKHAVCEKPLCLTLAEADEMIGTCRSQGVLLLYAEELFFAPKYARAKEMAEQGAFGKVYLVKQSEKHFGPHSDWFWDVTRSGGGVLMDMGCHGIAFCYWLLGRPRIRTVYAQLGTYVHRDKTAGDDDAVCILEFENGAVGVVETSWARRGGMDDRVEIYGEGGVTYANLLMGNALPTYSEYGFGYAVEKAPTTKGWTYPVFEELWNYGFPHEMRHFARCVRGKEEPAATGEDGRVVLEAIFAAYASAGAGRKIGLPYPAAPDALPIDGWRTRA
jgi:predicted dehydrogenase